MTPWAHPSPQPIRQGLRLWQTDKSRYSVCNNRPHLCTNGDAASRQYLQEGSWKAVEVSCRVWVACTAGAARQRTGARSRRWRTCGATECRPAGERLGRSRPRLSSPSLTPSTPPSPAASATHLSSLTDPENMSRGRQTDWVVFNVPLNTL